MVSFNLIASPLVISFYLLSYYYVPVLTLINNLIKTAAWRSPDPGKSSLFSRSPPKLGRPPHPDCKDKKNQALLFSEHWLKLTLVSFLQSTLSYTSCDKKGPHWNLFDLLCCLALMSIILNSYLVSVHIHGPYLCCYEVKREM